MTGLALNGNNINMGKKISRIVFWVVSVAFSAILLPVVIWQLFGYAPPEGVSSQYSYTTRLLLSFVVALATFALIVLTVRLPALPRRTYALILLGLAGLTIITEVILAHALISHGHGWDVQTVNEIARNYAAYGSTESTNVWNNLYLAKYGNNTPITLFLATSFMTFGELVGNNFRLISQIINSTAIVGSVFFVVYTAHKLYGQRASLTAFVLGYILIILSPYTPITYTDTLGMFFVAATVFFAVLCAGSGKKARLFWALLLGLMIACSYLIKPTGIFIGTAIVAVYIVKHIPTSKPTRAIKRGGAIALLCMLGLIGGIWGYQAALQARPNFARYTPAEIEANKTPIQHFLGMGSLRGLEPYPECTGGGFCLAYVNYMQSGAAEVSTVDGRRQYGLEVWRNSFESDFPSGYTGLLASKTLQNYSDGSFGVWAEGGDKVTFHNNTHLDEMVRKFADPFGSSFNKLKILLQITWMTVLTVIAAGCVYLWRNRAFREDYWQNCFRVAVLGVTFFLMIFEARARYLFLYVPVFILLAVGTITFLTTRGSSRKST